MNPALRLATALALILSLSAPQLRAQEVLPTTAAHYSVDQTLIGDLLDDPAACAVLDKHIPGFSGNDQVDLARGMTLRGIQPYAQDTMTDEVLANIDADLGHLHPATGQHGS